MSLTIKAQESIKTKLLEYAETLEKIKNDYNIMVSDEQIDESELQTTNA